MGKGLLEFKFGMGKGLIFQIIGMATERVRDPGPSLPESPYIFRKKIELIRESIDPLGSHCTAN